MGKFKSFVDENTFFNRMCDFASPTEPIAVLCHGDFWSNNILFKYSNSGEIEEVSSLLRLKSNRYLVIVGNIRRNDITYY